MFTQLCGLFCMALLVNPLRKEEEEEKVIVIFLSHGQGNAGSEQLLEHYRSLIEVSIEELLFFFFARLDCESICDLLDADIYLLVEHLDHVNANTPPPFHHKNKGRWKAH